MRCAKRISPSSVLALRKWYFYFGLFGSTDKLGGLITFCSFYVVRNVCSGGGYRAMIATAGFLKGAEKTGLLDSTVYLTGMSFSQYFAFS